MTIRQNVFESSRARGVLVATPGRVVIERNRFESSGSAILIAGDANQGYESGAVRDVTIRGNVFGPARHPTSSARGSSASLPRSPPPIRRSRFAANIRIEDNEFHPSDYRSSTRSRWTV